MTPVVLRQRLHERGFICKRIVFDAVTPSVYDTDLDLPKPGRFGNAAKSGAFSKRYGFIRRVNRIGLSKVTIMAQNLHSSIQNGESCKKFSARMCHHFTSHLLFFSEAIQNITIFPLDLFPNNPLSRVTDFALIGYF